MARIDYQWRYAPHKGHVRHAVPVSAGTTGQVADRAFCGASKPHSMRWYGTLNREQYEIMKKMRACAKCMRWLKRMEQQELQKTMKPEESGQVTELVWRFTSTVANTKHAVWKFASGKLDTRALCGRSPVWYSPDGWLGNLSDAQRESLLSLAECKSCAAERARLKTEGYDAEPPAAP